MAVRKSPEPPIEPEYSKQSLSLGQAIMSCLLRLGAELPADLIERFEASGGVENVRPGFVRHFLERHRRPNGSFIPYERNPRGD